MMRWFRLWRLKLAADSPTRPIICREDGCPPEPFPFNELDEHRLWMHGGNVTFYTDPAFEAYQDEKNT